MYDALRVFIKRALNPQPVISITSSSLLEFQKFLRNNSIGLNVTIDKRVIQQSTLVDGFNNLAEISNKLRNEICLSIVVLGGSISFGSSMNDENDDNAEHDLNDIPKGLNDAYPKKLQEMFQQYYPCKPIQSKVINLAVPAVGASYWIERFSFARVKGIEDKFYKSIKHADIVLVDVAINDLEGDEIYVEALIRCILDVSPETFIVFLEASGFIPSSWENVTDSSIPSSHMSKELPVIRHYNLSAVSIPQSMFPFDSEAIKNSYRYEFLSDFLCHPSKSGHMYIAAVLFSYILSLNTSQNFNMVRLGNPPLLLWTEEKISVLLSVRPFVFEFYKWSDVWQQKHLFNIYSPNVHREFVTWTSEWKVYEDVPHKSGLINFHVREFISILVPAIFVEKYMIGNGISVTLLKSYEHMGILQVTLSCKNITLASISVDCLWQSRSSQLSIVLVDYNVSVLRELGRQDVNLRLEIIEAKPPRNENKIKIHSIAIS